MKTNRAKGKEQAERTAKLVREILEKKDMKIIAADNHVHLSYVFYVKKRYIKEIVVLTLNERGVSLMNETQLELPLVRRSPENRNRSSILRSLGRDNKKDTWDLGLDWSRKSIKR